VKIDQTTNTEQIESKPLHDISLQMDWNSSEEDLQFPKKKTPKLTVNTKFGRFTSYYHVIYYIV